MNLFHLLLLFQQQQIRDNMTKKEPWNVVERHQEDDRNQTVIAWVKIRWNPLSYCYDPSLVILPSGPCLLHLSPMEILLLFSKVKQLALNGKFHEFIWLKSRIITIHADVWQRPPQHCKAIILQLKKKIRIIFWLEFHISYNLLFSWFFYHNQRFIH